MIMNDKVLPLLINISLQLILQQLVLMQQLNNHQINNKSKNKVVQCCKAI